MCAHVGDFFEEGVTARCSCACPHPDCDGDHENPQHVRSRSAIKPLPLMTVDEIRKLEG